MSRILGTQSYLHLLYRRSPSEWDQLTRTESDPISTGPFPTWDDCQQLLQVLLTRRNGSESWQRRGNESQGLMGDQPPSISWMRGFLCCGLTEILSEEGREHLRVYRQTLMAGLRAAARKPTNLAKVNLVRPESH